MRFVELPLYPTPPQLPLDEAGSLPLDPKCTRCPRHRGAHKVCSRPAAIAPAEGGVYVVGDVPSGQDRGQPFTCPTGHWVRAQIAKHHTGATFYDVAVRCVGGKLGTLAEGVEKCRPYLKQLLSEASPRLVLAFGRYAIEAFTGYYVDTEAVRGGFVWWKRADGVPIRVVFLPGMGALSGNRFVQRDTERRIREALTEVPMHLPAWHATLRKVETPEQAQAACEDLAGAGWFALDTEGAGQAFSRYFELSALAAVPAGEEYAYVWSREALKHPLLVAPLTILLADPGVGKVGQNLKFDLHALQHALKVTLRNVHADSMLMHKLLHADANADLEALAELVGMGGHKLEQKEALAKAQKAIQACRRNPFKYLPFDADEALIQATFAEERDIQRWKRWAASPEERVKARLGHPDKWDFVKNEAPWQQYAYALTPPDVTQRYCALDTLATARLVERLTPEVAAEPGVQLVWNELTGPATEAIAQIEAWGIAASREAIEQCASFFSVEIERLRGSMRGYTDCNPDSPKQLQKYLYESENLAQHLPKRLRTARSTDAKSLKALRDKHPFVPLLMEYRKVSKLQSSYGATLAGFIQQDGRIHPNLKIAGTSTGRLSCVQPALHQIPRAEDAEGTGFGRLVKDCFVSQLGHKLVQFDFSQLELRKVAILSGDTLMQQLFADESTDFHMASARVVAPVMWGITDPALVTKAHRTATKTFIFGLIYGMTDNGLAERIGCSVAEASKLRQAILGKFVGLAAWCKKVLKETRETGVARTVWRNQPARVRELWDIAAQGEQFGGFRANAENAAVNTPVQGSASDLCLGAILRVVPWIVNQKIPAKLVLTVHDSIILEVRDDWVDRVVPIVKRMMTDWDWIQGVPLKVDVEVGTAWGSLSTYTRPDETKED